VGEKDVEKGGYLGEKGASVTGKRGVQGEA